MDVEKKKTKSNLSRTKTPCIYYNEVKKMYEVKCNYTIHDVNTGKSKSSAIWSRNIGSISAAKDELLRLRESIKNGGVVDSTMEDVYKLWVDKATANNFSPKSLKNTKQAFQVIDKFLGKEFKIKDVNESVYLGLFARLRQHGYAEATLATLNANFRKFINLAYRRNLVKENPLHKSEAISTEEKNDRRVIPYYHFLKIKEYFEKLGTYKYGDEIRRENILLLYMILYYTGIRIGECLALTWKDFVEFKYESEYKDRGYYIKITKNYLSNEKVTKGTKNKKIRKIPVHSDLDIYFRVADAKRRKKGIQIEQKIFNFSYANCQQYLNKACVACELPRYTHHEFRHTFISNLIRQSVSLPVIEMVSGDTQLTILKTYSHVFQRDELIILDALEKSKKLGNF